MAADFRQNGYTSVFCPVPSGGGNQVAEIDQRPAHDTSAVSSGGIAPADKENTQWLGENPRGHDRLSFRVGTPGVSEIEKGSSRVYIDPATGALSLFANVNDEIVSLSGSGADSLKKQNNLSDILETSAAITNLGLGSLSISMSRVDVPNRIIPFNSFKLIGYYEDYDLGEGANYRAGRGFNATDIQDATGKWFTLVAPNECNVGWTGARGNGTNSTAAFATARSISPFLKVPRGAFGIKEFDLGDNAVLRGEHNQLTTLVALEDCDFMVRVGAASTIRDFKANGNLKASKCITMRGPYARCEKIYCQFPKYVANSNQFLGVGFFNETTSTRFTLESTITDNCRAGFQGGAGVNNCVINNHDSRGGDYYGIYTNSDDPSDAGVVQGLFITDCSFIGATHALWFNSLTFAIAISETTIDHIFGVGITLAAEGNSAIGIGPNNFITSNPGNNVIDVAAGASNVIIHNNQGVSNGLNCVLVRATPTKTCSNVHILLNNLGPGAETVVKLDSPSNDWSVAKNKFSPLAPSLAQVLVVQTFVDDGTLGFVQVDENCFPPPPGQVLADRVFAGGAFRIKAKNNKGVADIL